MNPPRNTGAKAIRLMQKGRSRAMKRKMVCLPLFLKAIFPIGLLILTSLACSKSSRAVDPTRLAPQDLSGKDFRYMNIIGYDFSGKDLRHVNLEGSKLSGSNFTDADLRDANLKDAFISFEGANFTRADLRGANLDGFCFVNVTWTDAKLDSHWAEAYKLISQGFKPGQNLKGTDFSSVCLMHYDLTGVDLQGGKFIQAKLAYAKFVGANLSDVDFKNANLASVDFSNANLSGADLTGAELGMADLTDANLFEASVTRKQLELSVLCRTILPDRKMSRRDCKETETTP